MCTKSSIILFDRQWTQLEPSVSKPGLTGMKAITYDPVRDIFYFSDFKHPKTSIFSLKVGNDTTFITEALVPRSDNERIEDLVYDFHDDALYWSDSGNKKIVKLIFDRSKNLKWRNETFLNVSGEVAGLEIDSCQRNLYFTIVTDKNPSINVVSMDEKGAAPVSFGSENHYKPTAIAMDHQKRRLYVADVRQSSSYTVDSLDASGGDFRTEYKNFDRRPRSLAVDADSVYYVEGSEHQLRRFSKNSEKKTSEKIQEMPSDPTDIIVRSNFVIDLDAKLCKVSPKKVEEAKSEMKANAEKVRPSKMCLHGGSLDKTTSNCMCKENFDGDFCEINLCYNFCLNGGDCSMERNAANQRLEPSCSCKRGFVGDHCEVDVCVNFCFNDGMCSVDISRKPTCACGDRFDGSRCENLKVDALTNSHDDARKEVELTTSTEIPALESMERRHDLPVSQAQEEHQQVPSCPSNQINLTFVILAVCFTISLLLFLVILVVIKRVNRPMRPKIRKKYVVHKNIEPLTYRPTTEQCEVIIEDCCNMNICETVSSIQRSFNPAF